MATTRAMPLHSSDDAEALHHLFLYWKEHGPHTRNPDTIAGSIRMIWHGDPAEKWLETVLATSLMGLRC